MFHDNKLHAMRDALRTYEIKYIYAALNLADKNHLVRQVSVRAPAFTAEFELIRVWEEYVTGLWAEPAAHAHPTSILFEPGDEINSIVAVSGDIHVVPGAKCTAMSLEQVRNVYVDNGATFAAPLLKDKSCILYEIARQNNVGFYANKTHCAKSTRARTPFAESEVYGDFKTALDKHISKLKQS